MMPKEKKATAYLLLFSLLLSVILVVSCACVLFVSAEKEEPAHIWSLVPLNSGEPIEDETLSQCYHPGQEPKNESYEAAVAEKVGTPASDARFNTSLAYVQKDDQTVDVTVTIDGFHDEDLISCLIVPVFYDDTCLTPNLVKNGDLSLNIFETLPGDKWENLSALYDREASKYGDPYIYLQILDAETKEQACDSSTSITATINFTLLEGRHQGAVWIENGRADATGWDLVDRPGTGGSVVAYQISATVLEGYQAPTCTEDGYSGDECCQDCGTVLSQGKTLSALGHTGGTATCHTKAVCTRCLQEYGEFNADNHDGGTELKNQAAATCTGSGYSGDTVCKGCGTVLGQGNTLSALGHTGGTATCHTKAVCTRCLQEYGGYDSNNHEGGTQLWNQKDATCTENGHTADTICLGCYDIIIQGEPIPALGHSYVSEYTKPTSQSNGFTVYRCSVCGDLNIVYDDPDTTIKRKIGDIDGDGKITAKDYVLLKRYVLKTYTLTEEQLQVADVNGDGKVNSKDYVMLKRIVLGTYELPVTPPGGTGYQPSGGEPPVAGQVKDGDVCLLYKSEYILGAGFYKSADGKKTALTPESWDELAWQLKTAGSHLRIDAYCFPDSGDIPVPEGVLNSLDYVSGYCDGMVFTSNYLYVLTKKSSEQTWQKDFEAMPLPAKEAGGSFIGRYMPRSELHLYDSEIELRIEENYLDLFGVTEEDIREEQQKCAVAGLNFQIVLDGEAADLWKLKQNVKMSQPINARGIYGLLYESKSVTYHIWSLSYGTKTINAESSIIAYIDSDYFYYNRWNRTKFLSEFTDHRNQ